MTIDRLPASVVPVSAASAAKVSSLAKQQRLTNEATVLQRQVGLEIAQLTAESAQLERRATLLQDAMNAQRRVTIAVARVAPTTTSSIPTTHATTGASSSKDDNDNSGGNDNDSN
ncbi:MAG: hypothetical protein HKL85_07715 [Acidimicrobiaceae bacterium]|nr:hypothetical protein [Acidimicrobiaceae bacterium]